jgi:hypothetical protein
MTPTHNTTKFIFKELRQRFRESCKGSSWIKAVSMALRQTLPRLLITPKVNHGN